MTNLNTGIDRSLVLPELRDDPALDPLSRVYGIRGVTNIDDIGRVIDNLHKRLDDLREYLHATREIHINAHTDIVSTLNGVPTQDLLAFFQDNVAANQTDVVLGNGGSGRGYVVVEEGSVVGIAVRTNDPRTAGTLTVEATVNGTKIGLTAVLDATNTTTKSTLQSSNVDTFDAGDIVSCVITTDASWAPTTADIDVSIAVLSAAGFRYDRL